MSHPMSILVGYENLTCCTVLSWGNRIWQSSILDYVLSHWKLVCVFSGESISSTY